MQKKYWSLILAFSIACAGFAVACGDDDDDLNPVPDGGPITETGPGNETGPGPDGGGDGGGDGGPDSGCTFATYVIGLVNNSTNATAKPDTTLGAGCKDTTTQAEFKPLFP